MERTYIELTDKQWMRFDTFVKESEGDGCWLWTGNKIKKSGYGRFHIGNKIYVKPHRLMWMRYKGRIPKGCMICHSCDNRLCVRLDHFFKGKGKDNSADRDSKLRHYHGERVNTNRLTEQQVRDIHARYDNSWGINSSLAHTYGVTPALITLIAKGEVWRHLNLPNKYRRYHKR